MANLRRNSRGYVLVGVSEAPATTKRVTQLTGAKPTVFNGFDVMGIDHEASHLKKNLDQYFQMIVDRVKTSKLSEPLRGYVTQHIKLVRYYDKSVFVLECTGQDNLSNYDSRFFIRNGNQLEELKPTDLADQVRRYLTV